MITKKYNILEISLEGVEKHWKEMKKKVIKCDEAAPLQRMKFFKQGKGS